MRHPKKLHTTAARMRELMPPDADEIAKEAAYHAARKQREADAFVSRLIERFGQIDTATYQGRCVLSDHWTVNGHHIYADSAQSAALRRLAAREGMQS